MLTKSHKMNFVLPKKKKFTYEWCVCVKYTISKSIAKIQKIILSEILCFSSFSFSTYISKLAKGKKNSGPFSYRYCTDRNIFIFLSQRN